MLKQGNIENFGMLNANTLNLFHKQKKHVKFMISVTFFKLFYVNDEN